MTLPALTDLATLTSPQLVELYNQLSQKPAIKKFETRVIALKRVTPLLEATLAQRAAEEALNAAPPKTKTEPRKSTSGVKPVSLSKQIRELIAEGLTNEAIIAKLQLPKNKWSYAAWNRAAIARANKGNK